MHDNRRILEARIERTLREKIQPAITTSVSALDVSAWRVPREKGVIGEPVAPADVPVTGFTPLNVGEQWGAPWETTWLRCTARIPSGADMALGPTDRLEARIDLGWASHSPGFQSEGLVRDAEGHTIKAINPRNNWVPLPQPGENPARYEFTVEAAANPLLLGVPPFQVTRDGDKRTASRDDLYALTRAEVVITHGEVYGLYYDVATLRELVAARENEELDGRGWEILLALSHAIDTLDLDDIAGTASRARAVLAPVLAQPADASSHRLSAVAHAHIDSAWLWPLRETKRKVNRTLANVVRLLEDGADFIFAFPAAQHAAWLEEQDPQLFERVRAQVKSGHIVPVGSMWVEADAQLPGAEAMARQFVEGARYFRDAFGYRCEEVWLPDSFGYSAALPQIAREAGIRRFLTQKISWNQVDKFPHHTFLWEGIDGSRLFTHFPPVDTYGSEVTGQQLHHAETNFQDKGRAGVSLLPYGYGDGGGGPTRGMLERIERYADLEGSPRIAHETPAAFFDRAEEDYPNPPVWVGELYLELHRGTLTSHVAVKQGNRRSESLLREAEHWAALAAYARVRPYPHEKLRDAWRSLLLCQFHDILPGTAIAWVYREVSARHARIAAAAEEIITASLEALTGASGTTLRHVGAESGEGLIANASAFSQHGVAALSVGAAGETAAGDTAAAGPGSGTGGDDVAAADGAERCRVTHAGRTVSNGHVTARFDEDGALISLVGEDGIELIPAGQRAGLLEVFQDFPNMWDAWDIDPFYRDTREVLPLHFEGMDVLDDRVTVRSSAAFQGSTFTIAWILENDARSLDVQIEAEWHGHEHLVKLALPVAIHTSQAQFETQFGHLVRPTHENTSWDAYRFEVSAHRWLRLANASAALGIANDSTYGWDLTRHAYEQEKGPRRHETWTLVRATLLKSARFPDPEQDQGHFEWNFRLHPGASTLDAVADGQQLNLGERYLVGATPVDAPFAVEGAVVESVAVVPDTPRTLAVRVYEAQGGPSTVTLRAPAGARVALTNLLYEPSDEEPTLVALGEDRYRFDLGAFQLATITMEPRDE
ncbi:alpha-mannosidase [Neoactinobaculum massilliense]|uniref:alpha-mannosidase n=1 Tax=Neoactinobaculum massilliense TaxID=2364794 RepID=UPI000F540877|nr:alpha-mannosidase [Neoactinobaculum massilliense]